MDKTPHPLPDFSALFSRGRAARHYASGAVIFKDGDFADEMYVVRQGHVEIRVGSHVVETLGVGQIFGEMALIDKSPRSASAVAVGAVELVALDEASFLFLVQQTPYFSLNVMRTLAARLRHMDKLALKS